MTVTVVIVAWNGRDDLRKCLDALQVGAASGCEIIVVDNASTDGTSAMLERDYPQVVLLRQDRNLGFAEGCNLGIAAASGEWIATLNPDTEVDGSWLTALTAQIEKGGDKLGMLQPRMLFMDEPGLVNSRGIDLIKSGFGVDRGFRGAVDDKDRVEEIFCPTAGAALYRKAMLDEVRLDSGYFDRGFFMYGEDFDLGWRCRLSGWKALYVPASTVFHRYQASSAQKGGNFAVSQMRKNRLRALLKNGSLKLILRNIPHVAYDFWLGLKFNGLRAIPDLFAAIFASLRQRGEVTRLARIGRAALEKRWVRPG